jgi:hypothetical protein
MKYVYGKWHDPRNDDNRGENRNRDENRKAGVQERLLPTIALLLVVAVAGWWVLSTTDQPADKGAIANAPAAGALQPGAGSSVTPSTPGSSVGQGQGTPAPSTRDYFVEYRLERGRRRSEEMDIYREIINNPNTSAEVRAEAQQNLMTLAKAMETELNAENLINSKGYADSVLFYKDGYANVVVKAETITDANAIEIADIVAATTGLEIDKVRVSAKTH